MTAEQLKKTIEEKGIKQVWIAKNLNVAKSLVSQWVSGTTPIPNKHLTDLIELLAK